jgi:hypothetical protein
MITRVFELDVDFEKSVTYRPISFVKGDHGSCKLMINISQDITGLRIFVAFELSDGTKLLHEAAAGNEVAELILPSGVLSVAGRVNCQVAIYSDPTAEDRLTNPVGFYFTVAEDLAEEAVAATDQVPVLTQLITDAHNMLDQFTYLEGVAADTEQAKIDAQTAETNAEQVLADLLAMIGSDIATLTGGKLTPSQIPDLSINEVLTILDESELVTLNAQRGDCAIVVPDDVVTESFILAADDPTVLANWKKLGVSYVAESGHSVNADEAVNATKINNKRLVAMTQSQYDAAVLDPDTIYVVTPD